MKWVFVLLVLVSCVCGLSRGVVVREMAGLEQRSGSVVGCAVCGVYFIGFTEYLLFI